MDDLVRTLSVAIDTAREAGAMLRQEFHRPGGPRGSGDHADIDREAEELIQKRLLAAFPWNDLGEELGRIENNRKATVIVSAEPACVHPHILLMPQEAVDTFYNYWPDHFCRLSAGQPR
jgi:hypothetical protein